MRESSVRRITLALLVAMLAYACANSLMNVLLNDVIDAFAVVGTQQGYMSSMISVGTLAAVISTPFLQGRLKKTTIIILSGLLLTLGALLTGASASFPMLIGVGTILGVGVGWIDVTLSAAMIDAHPSDAPKYLGVLHGFFGIGGLAAPVIITALLAYLTWRGVYFTFGVFLVAAFSVVFFLFRAARGTSSSAAPAEAPLTAADIAGYVKRGRNWLLIICSVMAFTTQTGIVVWIMRYLQIRFGTDALGGAAISLYWVFLTINRFLAPRLPVKPMKLFTVGSALFALAMFIGIAADSPAALCAAIAVGGMTSGHLIPVLLSECAAGYEGQSTLTTSAVMLSMCASRIVTPLLMAWLTVAASPVAGMLTVPVSGVLAAVFGLAVLKTKVPERSAVE